MKYLSFIIVLFVSTNLFSQTVTPLHFSVVHGLSTDGRESKETDYRFSLNLISGRVHSIKGVEMGAIFNQNDGDMTGIQMAGMVNRTHRTVTGYQYAGFSNISGDVYGWQQSGLSNHASNVTGVQITGVVNTAKAVKGIQVSGLLNKTETLEGVQFGLINIADSVAHGGGIGLINIYKTGGHKELELSAADYQNVGISFKTGTNHFYTLFNVGYNFEPTPLFSAGLGIGAMRPIGAASALKLEIVHLNYITQDFNLRVSTQSTHLKLGYMRTFGQMALNITPSIYYAPIGKDLEGDLTEFSLIEPLFQREKSRWGYGLAVGVSYIWK
jgi:hypothetical protein